MPVAIDEIVRCMVILVGTLMIGCAGVAVEKVVETTPPARIAWLKAELARAEVLTHHLHGAYLPRGVPGTAMVCSLALQIEPWYGAGAEKWELTNASTTMRDELERIGIRDCILDVNH